MPTTTTTTHRMHWIGRPECVAGHCEPDLPGRLVEPIEITEARHAERRRQPFIARRAAR